MTNDTSPEANRGLHLNAPDLEIAQTLADVQVRVTGSKGETEAVRPWITTVMDRSSGEVVHVGLSTRRPTVPVSVPKPFSPPVAGRVERWFRRLHQDLKS